MFTIGEASNLTGLSSHTLRYYEKLGLIPSPLRESGGIRTYTQSDIDFICFLVQLKQTGMSLDEIKEFVGDGCIIQQIEEGKPVSEAIHKRMELLNKHLLHLKEQQEQINHIYSYTQNKLAYYSRVLEAETKDKSTD